MPLAEQFAAILADTGVSHGLIGPREVPRLWERHLLNCAVIADAFPREARLIDVGSGAGLPGVVLAIVRPDLEVHLVEPMLRRTQWLEGVVADLGLASVTVHRGRAEEFAGVLAAPYVTARAVARLDKLARWCVPLREPQLAARLVAAGNRRADDFSMLALAQHYAAMYREVAAPPSRVRRPMSPWPFMSRPETTGRVSPLGARRTRMMAP